MTSKKNTGYIHDGGVKCLNLTMNDRSRIERVGEACRNPDRPAGKRHDAASTRKASAAPSHDQSRRKNTFRRWRRERREEERSVRSRRRRKEEKRKRGEKPGGQANPELYAIFFLLSFVFLSLLLFIYIYHEFIFLILSIRHFVSKCDIRIFHRI